MSDFEFLDETQLRHLCDRLGLPPAGNSNVLRHRVRQYYNNERAHNKHPSPDDYPVQPAPPQHSTPPRPRTAPGQQQRGGYAGGSPARGQNQAKKGITVVGACNFDLIAYVPRLPAEGETLHGNKFQMGCGGKGANQAVMAAKLGGKVYMVSKLGDDTFGRVTRENFAEWGVDATHVGTTNKAASGVAPICVDEQGRNSIVIVTGANDLITLQEVEAARRTIRQSAVLVTGLEVPFDIALRALKIAREEGVLTILNPAPAVIDLPDEFFELSDIVCPNESETEILTGHPVDSEDEAIRAGTVLLDRGAGKVILTLGARGSVLLEADREPVFVGASKVKAIDTTGAGDSFLGSLAYFIAEGLPLPECMRRAGHIASMSVTKTGTQTSFPTAQEVPREIMRI